MGRNARRLSGTRRFYRISTSSLRFCRLRQDSAWTKLLTLNLHRVFTLTQKCLPLLREAAKQGGIDGAAYKDPARIINVRSPRDLATISFQAVSRSGLLKLSVCQITRLTRIPRRKLVCTISAATSQDGWDGKGSRATPSLAGRFRARVCPSTSTVFNSTYRICSDGRNFANFR